MDDTLLTIYPYNLIYDIFKSDEDKDELFVYEVYIPAFLGCLESLGEQWRQIIEMRYRDKMTYKAIGEKFKLSASRIGQIVKKTLRKLSYPSRSRGYILGIKAVEQMEQLYYINENLTAELAKLRDEAGIYPPFTDISIRDLDLPIRPYNCLCRAGIKTLADLEGLSRSDLLQMRNMGLRSIEAIEDAVSKYGLSFA